MVNRLIQTNSTEEGARQPANPNQRVHTSPMGYTGNPAQQIVHAPINQSTEALPPPPPPPPPTNANRLDPPTSQAIPLGNAKSVVSSKSAASPPPPPSSDSINHQGGNGRGALLDQIKQGANLKKVEASEINKKPLEAQDSRDALMRSIQEGKKLKPVSDRKLNETTPKPPKGNNTNSNSVDLQEALRKALKARKPDTPPSSDSEESDDEFND